MPIMLFIILSISAFYFMYKKYLTTTSSNNRPLPFCSGNDTIHIGLPT